MFPQQRGLYHLNSSSVVSLLAYAPAAPLNISLFASLCFCRLDCPMFRVPPDVLTAQASLVFGIMDAMQPSTRLMGMLQR